MTSSKQPDIAGGAELGWQSRRVFLVGLTATAGWLDALAFLYLGKVFISFMSGNLLFLGIGAGTGDGGLVVRAGAVLVAFLVGAAVGARLSGSRLAPGTPSALARTLRLELFLLAAFAVLWLATGDPADDPTLTLALLVVGATAMGVQAATALAFRLPNVATVAMTGTLAQLGALVGWRAREGHPIVAQTPAVSLMIPLCLAYVISAVIVATVPETPVIACGPLLLLASAVVIEDLLAPREVPGRRVRSRLSRPARSRA
jgi:uncharacterized membrane protein YoaK (UPF0700 family)